MNDDGLGSDALEPPFPPEVQRAWASFVVNGDYGNAPACRVVRDAWLRCRDAQATADVTRIPLLTIGDDLERMTREHHALLSAAREVAPLLAPMLNDTQRLLAIADPQGVILDVHGDPRVRREAQARHVAPGCGWHHHASGTAVTSTAIAFATPLQVRALEHVCEGAKDRISAAALVREQDGTDIVGVVYVTGPNEASDAHGLALALAAANQIEAILRGREARDRVRLLQRCNETAADRPRDGLIVLDAKGRVVSTGRHAVEVLRRRGIDTDLGAGRMPGAAGCGRVRRAGVSLPGWIDAGWLHPIALDGRALGMLVVVPARAKPARAVAGTACRHVEPAAARRGFSRIVGDSRALRAAVHRARSFAATEVPVLLLGEPGVGKAEFARAIHEASSVAAGPFVAIDCGTLGRDPDGREPGRCVDCAFPGGRRRGRGGLFEAADGGTLFLDEIGELPLELQPRLLRVLEEGIVVRPGETHERRVRVRLVAATRRDLRADVLDGRFHQALYCRLVRTILPLPPLRARQWDTSLLAEHFLCEIETRHGGRCRTLSAEINDALNRYAWPGNLRELRNVIDVMWHRAESREPALTDLCLDGGPAVSAGSTPAGNGLKALERAAIEEALTRHGGNLSRAARELGIARSTLYQKLELYGLRAKS